MTRAEANIQIGQAMRVLRKGPAKLQAVLDRYDHALGRTEALAKIALVLYGLTSATNRIVSANAELERMKG